MREKLKSAQDLVRKLTAKFKKKFETMAYEIRARDSINVGSDR